MSNNLLARAKELKTRFLLAKTRFVFILIDKDNKCMIEQEIDQLSHGVLNEEVLYINVVDIR